MINIVDKSLFHAHDISIIFVFMWDISFHFENIRTMPVETLVNDWYNYFSAIFFLKVIDDGVMHLLFYKFA